MCLSTKYLTLNSGRENNWRLFPAPQIRPIFLASSLEAFSYNPHPVHQQIPGSSFQSHFHCHPTGASHQAQATGISDWACCNWLIIWSLVPTASSALSNQSDASNDFCSHLESNPKFWLRPTEPSKMTPPDSMSLPTLTHSASATLTFLLLLKHSEHLSTLRSGCFLWTGHTSPGYLCDWLSVFS